ncbi:glycosyltransferase family protein [Pelagibacteraceae bacterium]|nr:glycosyltransferase family protein [Pelagibacteraceae bacterium]
MKKIIILQARLSSKRLPGKVLKKVQGIPLIEILLRRISRCKNADKIIVAIPRNRTNEKLYKFLKKKKYNIFRGNENNVLERFYYTAKKAKANIIVRLTADNPLVDPLLIDDLIDVLIKKKMDYVTNSYPYTFPDGLDVEVFTFNCLKKCYQKALSKFDKEHVTTYIRKSERFKSYAVVNEKDLSKIRITVDADLDLEVIEEIIINMKNIHFSWKKIEKLYKEKPFIFSKNAHLKKYHSYYEIKSFKSMKYLAITKNRFNKKK